MNILSTIFLPSGRKPSRLISLRAPFSTEKACSPSMDVTQSTFFFLSSKRSMTSALVPVGGQETEVAS